MSVRTIAVVTGTRADYGILRPLLTAIAEAPDLAVRLIVTGSHLAPAFGRTVDEITADGFDTSERVEMLIAGDSPGAVATSIGVGAAGFAARFAAKRPDLVFLTGDRYEMLSAAVAALPFALPLAHLHGGEVSEGAIDEQIRHAMSKMAHLHFASTPMAAERLRGLGEQAWRITVSGAPALDNLRSLPVMPREDLERRLGLELRTPPLIVTFHPATLQIEDVEHQVGALTGALSDIVTEEPRPVVITYPNADTANGLVAAALQRFTAAHPRVVMVPSLGTVAYFSLLRIAGAMAGNSSSGILEAPTFELPVVNVGERQAGRDRAANVIDVPAERGAIRAAMARALTPEFKRSLRGLANPYGDGHAAGRIVEVLQRVPLDRALLTKTFVQPQPAAGR